jgi:hypothetical protein
MFDAETNDAVGDVVLETVRAVNWCAVANPTAKAKEAQGYRRVWRR